MMKFLNYTDINMKKKTGKHLRFYIDCMNNGSMMPVVESDYRGGLCSISDAGLIDQKIFNLFSFGKSDFHFWATEDAREDSYLFSNRRNEFTELRQTIVLLMAAINNEL